MLTHVVLHARLEARYADAGGREVKRELKRAGFGKALLDANLRKLEKLVGRLEFKPGRTAWTEYGQHEHVHATRRPPARPSSSAQAAARHPAASSGTSAATTARTRAWRPSTPPPSWPSTPTTPPSTASTARLRDEERTDILPLVMSLTDPSPDLGWRGLERARLERRGTPDLALALALIHHVVITGNVPVREFVAWLRSLDCALVIEFPERDDPMVQKLLSGQDREGQPGLRARDVRARPRRAVRGRAHGAARLPDALRGPPTRIKALHLAALWAFAFAQPLFNLLGDQAQFFVARGSTAGDIVLFALVVTLVPPALLTLLVWLAGKIRPALGDALQLVFVGLLAAAILLPPIGDLLGGSAISVPVALLAGAGARDALRPRRARPLVRHRHLAGAAALPRPLPVRLAGLRARAAGGRGGGGGGRVALAAPRS